ncbi:hypothetical protein [Actinoallomurus soli]|uniref:hypothetical protein n=1 Tax=Actinoallomurus soli TaxID=2952535 RepID=UPI0020925EDA|nr:hypothetical protein [Actinoallomurus soli]MCO5975092.1 hypothetical protein [Actinoallomurus soli]
MEAAVRRAVVGGDGQVRYVPLPRNPEAGLSVKDKALRAVGPRDQATGREGGLPYRPPAQMDDPQAGADDELLRVLWYATRQLERDRVPDAAGRCLQFAEAVLAGLFPQGIKPPAGVRSVDDTAASADLSARRLLNQPGSWSQVRSWEAVFEAVQGENTATVVIVGRPAVSHALVLINTTHGVKVLDYNGGTAVLNDFTPAMTHPVNSPLGPVAAARALHIDLATAQPVTNAKVAGGTTARSLSSQDIVDVLTDKASPAVGAPRRPQAPRGADGARAGQQWELSQATPRSQAPFRPAAGFPVEGRPRAMPTFTVTSSVQELDQARRVTRYERQGAAEQPPGPEGLLITGWSTLERRLVYRPQSDQVFPWRDHADPLNRVFAPFADAQGRLHPAVQVHGVRIAASMRRYLDELARTDPRLNLARPVREVIDHLEHDVQDLVMGTITGNTLPPRMVARILGPGDLPAHEQVLVGQYGAFLSEEIRAAPPGRRPLLSEGRVLGLYAGVVLDDDNAVDDWQRAHPAFPDYAMNIDSRSGRNLMMSSEGFAGVTAFANTRLLPNGEPDLRPAGINAEFLPFHVRLTDNRGRVRWQTIVAMVALDNLYGDHNPSGMVIADYGPRYQMRAPQIKPDPDNPPNPISLGSPSPAAPTRTPRAATGADRLARVQDRVRQAGERGLTIRDAVHAYDHRRYDRARFEDPNALGEGFRLVGDIWYTADDAPAAPTRTPRAPQAATGADRLARAQERVRQAGERGLTISNAAHAYNPHRYDRAPFEDPNALGEGFRLVGDIWYTADDAPAAPTRTPRAPRAATGADRLARVQDRVRQAGERGLTISNAANAYSTKRYDRARFEDPNALGEGFRLVGDIWYTADDAPAAPTRAPRAPRGPQAPRAPQAATGADRLARAQDRVRQAGERGLTIRDVANAYDPHRYDRARFEDPNALGEGFRLVGDIWYTADDAPAAPTRTPRAPRAATGQDRLARVQDRVRQAGERGLAISDAAKAYSRSDYDRARFEDPNALGEDFELSAGRWYYRPSGQASATDEMELDLDCRADESGYYFQVNNADVSDAVNRGLRQTLKDTTDPALRTQLHQALASWTRPPAAATGHHRPTPNIDRDGAGIKWTSSSHSGYDPNGQPIPAGQKACVEVGVSVRRMSPDTRQSRRTQQSTP